MKQYAQKMRFSWNNIIVNFVHLKKKKYVCLYYLNGVITLLISTNIHFLIKNVVGLTVTYNKKKQTAAKTFL